ncbi:MAG: hypothetical protein K8F24_06780, partial [Bacteroidales bacterium]|nr:hypothetical protein [Bacteroidales bacterium]
KDIQKQIDQIMQGENNRSIPEFEGYSPFEMHQVLNFTFAPNSPVQLQELSDADFKKVPLLNQLKYLMALIAEKGELKLTAKGFLPTKVVADIYQQRFLEDVVIKLGISRLYREADSMTVNLTRILLEISGLVKKRKGKLSLTKTGEKMLKDDFQLLKRILAVFTEKFNWAYYDGYGDNRIGQTGYGFSLILLSKYGHKKRLDSFYAGKYFKAFPQFLDSLEPNYGTLESYSADCYAIRTFDRFLDYLGLIKIEEVGKRFDRVKYVTKTDLFDRLIKVCPHKNHVLTTNLSAN